MKEALLALSKDSIIYGVGSVITRFIGLATLPLFTTYITPAEYGILAVLALLAMFVQPIFSLGLSAAMGLSYFEKDDLTAKSTVVWSMFVINLVSASLLILLAWTQPTFLAGVVALPDHYSHLISVS
jgi:O-antigen/teichoic acid export membrane protein